MQLCAVTLPSTQSINQHVRTFMPGGYANFNFGVCSTCGSIHTLEQRFFLSERCRQYFYNSFKQHYNDLRSISMQLDLTLHSRCRPCIHMCFLHVIFLPIALNIITRRAGNCNQIVCSTCVCSLFQIRITMQWLRRHSFGSKSEGGPLQLLPSMCNSLSSSNAAVCCGRLQRWVHCSCIKHLSLSLGRKFLHAECVGILWDFNLLLHSIRLLAPKIWFTHTHLHSR